MVNKEITDEMEEWYGGMLEHLVRAQKEHELPFQIEVALLMKIIATAAVGGGIESAIREIVLKNYDLSVAELRTKQ